MKRLIDKDALVAEIERRATFFMEESKKKTTLNDSSCAVALYGLLSFIDTLEVKEVDYDKEITEYLNNFENANIGHRLSLRRCAKHFFELGLSVSNKAQKGEKL